MEGAGRGKMNLPLAFLFWAVMVVIAIINNFVGEKLVKGLAGDYASHLYRTFFIIAVIFFFSRVYLKKTAANGSIYLTAISAGLAWLASSLVFEFIAGHYVFGLPWERILADYRIGRGRLWSLVLASEVVAPLVNAYLLR